MATVAAPHTGRQSVATGAHDRMFYGSIAVVMALTVFAGFARTYYLRAYFGRATVAGAT